MKKILLATTILGMSAGFAAAQVSFKGEGTAGFAQNGTANDGFDQATVEDAAPLFADDALDFYSSFKLSVTAAAETDSGLTFGASTSATFGNTYTFGDEDGFEAKDGAFGAPTLYVGGEFGKVEFNQDGFKTFSNDDNETYDLNYSGTFGGLTVGVRTDLNTAADSDSYDEDTAGTSSIKLGYEISGVTLGAAYDELGGAWNVSAARAFGPIKATVAAASDVDGVETQSVTLAYAAEPFTASLKIASDETWEVKAGYKANGISVNAKTDDGDAWNVTAGYDLGGGLSVEAGTNYTEDMYVGAKMSF